MKIVRPIEGKAKLTSHYVLSTVGRYDSSHSGLNLGNNLPDKQEDNLPLPGEDSTLPRRHTGKTVYSQERILRRQ